jgi:hypothetical protein
MIITGLSTPTAETYCKARASIPNFEKITRVQMGSINNYSDRAPGGYMDYRGRVTEISKGGSQGITLPLAVVLPVPGAGYMLTGTRMEILTMPVKQFYPR